MASYAVDPLPDRLEGIPFDEWAPVAPDPGSPLINTHVHHDTNPWAWDGLRVVAELWRRGVARAGIAAFDSGRFIDSIGELSRYAGTPIPCFIEALTLTPGDGEIWNDLPGRMYVEAGPFATSAEAEPLSAALTERARRRAEHQAGRWNAGLDLGFDYRPDWNALAERGITEANLSREIVDAIRAQSPDPDAVWRRIPGLDADPNDANFARAFRNATMVAETAIARVPRTPEFYLSVQEFNRLSDEKARYMYVGKQTGREANRAGLISEIMDLGFAGLCAIPERNLDTPEHAADFARFMVILDERGVPTILGTELNAHGQWWSVDLSRPPFSNHRRILDETWAACESASVATPPAA